MVIRQGQRERELGEPRPRVLLTGCDEQSDSELTNSLVYEGYDVTKASSRNETLALVRTGVDVVVLPLAYDIQKSDADGVSLLAEVKDRSPETQVIVTSHNLSLTEAITAIRRGAFWYLRSPVDYDELSALIDRAVALRSLGEENRRLRRGFGAVTEGTVFVGTSPVLRELLDRALRFAEIDSTVLITGETGTGKSTLARFMHEKSPRREGPFVSVNCSAIPRDLVEAELFGHERGAFTGAHAARAGYVEHAEGGTLFLDEIGELPLALQPKLLHLLQERTYRRVGSTTERRSQARVMAATNQPLEVLVRERQFREDLYYRLNVLPIIIPPLRHHPEDIAPLAEFILERMRARSSQPRATSIAEEGLQLLQMYHWPGNVRELENVLERALVLSKTPQITAQSIELPTASNVTRLAPPPPRSPTIQDMERDLLLRTLEQCNWNKRQTAIVLGVSTKSVYNKIQRFGIVRGE